MPAICIMPRWEYVNAMRWLMGISVCEWKMRHRQPPTPLGQRGANILDPSSHRLSFQAQTRASELSGSVAAMGFRLYSLCSLPVNWRCQPQQSPYGAITVGSQQLSLWPHHAPQNAKVPQGDNKRQNADGIHPPAANVRECGTTQEVKVDVPSPSKLSNQWVYLTT